MSKLSLTMAIPEYDHTRDVVSGRVPVEGIDLTCLIYPVEEIFYRFIVYKEFDVAEISFAKYSALIAQGNTDFFALPIFPSRVFRHSSLYVRDGGPIKKITDLKGRKVGIPEWAQTAAVYSRGFLQDQYGIELSSIHWVQAGVNQPGRIEKVDLKLPKGVEITRIADKSLNEMLLSGEIDAALVARAPDAFVKGDPKIRRLFDDFVDVEIDYYKRTKIFPIMHVLVIKKEVYEKNSWIPRSLYKAFCEAKDLAIKNMHISNTMACTLPWLPYEREQLREIFGPDWWPYGVEANRHALESLIRYMGEQGLLARKLGVDELFAPNVVGEFKI